MKDDSSEEEEMAIGTDATEVSDVEEIVQPKKLPGRKAKKIKEDIKEEVEEEVDSDEEVGSGKENHAYEDEDEDEDEEWGTAEI